MSAWTPRPRKWEWRTFLTEDEVAEVAAADKAEWQHRQGLCTKIQNRAIQRAKYAAGAKISISTSGGLADGSKR